MDTGVPWACEACGVPNAGYRRRCQDCGAKRPADPTPVEGETSAEPAPPHAVEDIPMPLVARRPERKLGRAPAFVLVVAVVALAIYGAYSYFTAEGPTPEEDEADVLAALEPFPDVPSNEIRGFCPEVDVRDLQEVATHITAGEIRAAEGADIAVTVFDNPVAARDYVDHLQQADCDETIVREGRTVVIVRGPVADSVRDQVLDRLELEG